MVSSGNHTSKADAGEIAPILLFLCVNTARIVLAGCPLAGIKFFTESPHILLITVTGKSRLKHKCTVYVTGVL